MKPPAHLPPDIASIWVETVKNLGYRIDRLDPPSLEAYCGQIARLRDAQHRIHDEGLIVADSKGHPIPHPAIAVEKSAQAEIRAWQSRLL